MAGFVTGQTLTAAALNAAFALCFPSGGVSTYSSTLLAQSSASAWLASLGLGTPGAANGLATLNASGQVPSSQLPAGLAGPMSYQGQWNATTNNPALASGTGAQGATYQVSVAGTTNLDGITNWNQGEFLTFNGAHWVKVGLTNPVTSVAGRTGAIVLSSADLSDGVTGTGAIVKTSGAALTGATLTNPNVGTQAFGNNTALAASTAFVQAAIANLQPPTVSPVRQTVSGGPVQTSGWPGAPSFLPSTSASLSITTQNISSSYPLTATAANGEGLSGPVDAYGMSTSNLTWNALAANATSYLYVSIANGALTPGSTTLAPIYQWGGAPSVTNGQFTFNIGEMRGYMGNGTTAPQASIVFIGQVVTSNTGVTSSTAYAYKGQIDTTQAAGLPGAGNVTVVHNLGLNPGLAEFVVVCNTTADSFTAGQIIEGVTPGGVIGSSIVAEGFGVIKGTVQNQFASTGYWVTIAPGGTISNLANADFNWLMRFRRGWGGS